MKAKPIASLDKKQKIYLMAGQMAVLFVFASLYTLYIINNPGQEVMGAVVTFPVAVLTLFLVMLAFMKRAAKADQSK